MQQLFSQNRFALYFVLTNLLHKFYAVHATYLALMDYDNSHYFVVCGTKSESKFACRVLANLIFRSCGMRARMIICPILLIFLKFLHGYQSERGVLGLKKPTEEKFV
jgi:hypothetical protein